VTSDLLLWVQIFTYELVLRNDTFSDLEVQASYLDGVAQALPLTAQLSQTFTLGLRNNTIYDVISDNNGTGTAIVGAVSFSVSCGSLQTKDLSSVSTVSDSTFQAGKWWNISWNAGENMTCLFNIPFLSMNVAGLSESRIFCFNINIHEPNYSY
jgi:hypothetical protein